MIAGISGRLVTVLTAGLLLLTAGSLDAQSREQDPDSLISRWMDEYEWPPSETDPGWVDDLLREIKRWEDRREPAGRCYLTVNRPVTGCPEPWAGSPSRFPCSVTGRAAVTGDNWDFRWRVSVPPSDTAAFAGGLNDPARYSAGILVRPGNVLHLVAMGDYRVNIGFGAVAGHMPLISAGPAAAGALGRRGTGIRLATGSATQPALRGIAMESAGPRLKFLMFLSGKSIHSEGLAGAGVRLVNRYVETGFNLVAGNRQNPWLPADRWLDSLMPAVNTWIRFGPWIQARIPSGIVFAETGFGTNGSMAWVAGFRLFESRGWSFLARGSGCAPDYPNLMTVFQSGSRLSRESRRLSLHWSYRQGRSLEFHGCLESAWADWPESHFGIRDPEISVSQQIILRVSGSGVITASVKTGFPSALGAEQQRMTLRGTFDSDPYRDQKCRYRISVVHCVSWTDFPRHQGSAADCSLSASIPRTGISCTIGFRIFHASDGGPVYAWEPDLTGGFASPVWSGVGSRIFVTMKAVVKQNWILEVKAGNTAYQDPDHEGKGGWSWKVQLGYVW